MSPRRPRLRLAALALAAAALTAPVAAPAVATAGDDPPPGVQRLKFRYGPITIAPGDNRIFAKVTDEKPGQEGFITRINPNLRYTDGRVPRVDVLHLHHGVWLAFTGRSSFTPGGVLSGEVVFATGEEKTIISIPRPYGYPVKPSDRWVINYMIHNLTASPARVYLTYDLDFVPRNSPLGRRMRAAYPMWNDVEAGSGYPVYDVHRRSGRNGRHTYPDMVPNAYAGRPRANERTIDRPITLVAAYGHVHPGGLHTDLDVVRPGATPAPGTERGAVPNSVRIFRSEAKYFEPARPVSWDMAMTHTVPSWRVGLKPGDKLRIRSTYETRRAAWYEAMGIIPVYFAEGPGGPDPFATRIPTRGRITHGHLPENNNHGGAVIGLPDPRRLPDGRAPGNRVRIRDFKYVPGGLGLPGAQARPPTIAPGESLTFVNQDPADKIFHSISSCRAPCNRQTGIAYPLQDGPFEFDSGQLGTGPPGLTAAANRLTYETPRTLRPGTYTYFCRVHPFMRGSFRVKERE